MADINFPNKGCGCLENLTITGKEFFANQSRATWTALLTLKWEASK